MSEYFFLVEVSRAARRHVLARTGTRYVWREEGGMDAYDGDDDCSLGSVASTNSMSSVPARGKGRRRQRGVCIHSLSLGLT